ncbi:hypothetical protein Patl1_05336 [Pistacia atlantica]|uniref:Uncharacterized protein n=1 Tax=Pistacia atlantica TaxID=434234 RepID=A0ACC1BW91_9ROSI|nr:hypothetical protein Patl1_05336 [Pistacia atlantica]
MADGILFDMAGRLLDVLESHIFHEIALAWGVKDDITKLKQTVRGVKAVLLDAQKQHSKKNDLVTEWLRRLEGVLYEADDLLDAFSLELRKREMMTGNKLAKEV